MTRLELAVAQLVANGLTNREIAERLFVSPHTVNTHLRQVFAKLEVNSRVDVRGLRQSATASTPPGTLAAAIPLNSHERNRTVERCEAGRTGEP
jgi:DNA-binding CsgD family transcriptional regulator